MMFQNAGPRAFGTTFLEAPDRHGVASAGGQEGARVIEGQS